MNEAGVLPFERLELIDDRIPKSAALNMAVDEVLLGTLGQAPRLRVYRWEHPAVSMGCFDRAPPVLARWPEHQVVRRWTGGGIVEHGEDFTFSLFVPRSLALATIPASESYRLIHAAVAEALARVGCAGVSLQPATAREAVFISRACFENAVQYDLLVGTRKVAGGAQRRTRHGLLHQGSIQGGPTASAAGTQTWGVELAAALPKAFSTLIEARSLNAVELAAAGTIAAAKYGAPAWLRRF